MECLTYFLESEPNQSEKIGQCSNVTILVLNELHKKFQPVQIVKGVGAK
jgi:hypothetical protein